MRIDDYERSVLRTANETLTPIEQLTNGLMGLNGEAGEAIDILKKHLYQGHKLDYDHLVKELGDVAWYLTISAHAIGVSLETVMALNVNKLKDRYPDGFDPDRSVYRVHGDI